MSWRPRLVATDLDGTLFSPAAQVTPHTARVLRAVHEAGIHVVAVTGRSHHTAIERLAPVGVVRHAVCSNGATRYDLVDDRLVSSHPIDDDHLVAILEALTAGLPGVGFGLEATTGFVYDEVFLTHLPRLRERGHRPGLLPPAQPVAEVVKVMVGHPDIDHHDLLARVVEVVPHDVNAATSGAPFVEVTAAGIDKASGLAAVCAELGVAAGDVLAFGDGDNDLPMLRWAGRGVAMANAHPTVLAATTERAGHHADEGVAAYLEALLRA